MLGHNQASPADLVHDTFADLGKFLAEHPVIQTEEQSKAAGLLVERTRKLFADLEDARKAEVGPLNDQVRTINNTYRIARGPVDNVLTELILRLNDYVGRENARRIREAEELRLAAEAAEMEARRAEEIEREAKQSATFGEVTDVAAAVVEADQKFNEFQRAERAAAVAERGTTVRLPSQLGGRALSMRNKETLVLDDWKAAIECMGMKEKIRDAVLSAARDYRKVHERLPAGVSATYSRSI